MRFFYFFTIILSLPVAASAQTVTVSGACISGSITLNKLGTNVNSKTAYQNAGTVAGFAGVAVSIYWLGAPDNVWVLDFDGQPYFQNACAFASPPNSSTTGCPWTVVTGTTCTGSALSITGTGTSLPVHFTSFVASKLNQQVVLNWVTASENNSKGFEVQRSTNNADWMKIGFVNGAINSNTERSYQFFDASPFNGRNYYRLAQYDIDNHQTLSPVVNIDFTLDSYYTLHNIRNGLYQITLQSSQPVELSVLDQSGRRLMKQLAGDGIHQIDITNYAAGIYLLQLKKDDQIVTEKIIKQ